MLFQFFNELVCSGTDFSGSALDLVMISGADYQKIVLLKIS